MAPLHIPAFVNYACQQCGWCCRQFDIAFSESDYARLAQYDWGALEPALAGKKWCGPLAEKGSVDTRRLRYGDGGACIFLTPDNLCRMHRHVGELGKTLGCCVYPFTFVSTPIGVYVNCRFSCRSVAAGIGEPVVRRREFLTSQYELCARAGRVLTYDDPIAVDDRQTMSWKDYLPLEETLIRTILRDDLPLVRRLFLVHKYISILRSANFDKLRGERLRGLLEILEPGLFLEAQHDPMPETPGRFNNLLFRQFCFLFQRRQGGAYRDMSFHKKISIRMRTFWTGVQFAAGMGSPRLNSMPGRTPLAAVPGIEVGLNEASELALSRFIAAKIFGKQYFGKLFFDYPLLDGLEYLLLSAAAVLWHARAHALARRNPVETSLSDSSVDHEDIVAAIRYIDFCYGCSTGSDMPLERLRTRILSRADTAMALIAQLYGNAAQTR